MLVDTKYCIFKLILDAEMDNKCIGLTTIYIFFSISRVIYGQQISIVDIFGTLVVGVGGEVFITVDVIAASLDLQS